MADYQMQDDTEMYGDEVNNNQYHDYGAEEEAMGIDDIPVTQEDAWAVIS
jgi:hypothetical protein